MGGNRNKTKRKESVYGWIDGRTDVLAGGSGFSFLNSFSTPLLIFCSFVCLCSFLFVSFVSFYFISLIFNFLLSGHLWRRR